MGVIDKIKAYEPYLSAKGREDLIITIQTYRKTYGKEWLEKFKAHNPDLCDFVDLIVNYDISEFWKALDGMIEGWISDESETWKRLAIRAAVNVFLPGAKPDIEKLHWAVKAEIDRPRF